ncbi:hypothetical protein AB0I35_13235 [Nocardia sp. NPDC050378]|uniref:hypothetical protein n=1 Tax=Nocardia sp. NPDC050378 TaxID=3155400 RepID=UPI0033E5BDCE
MSIWFCHVAPRALTVQEAHDAMQVHLECDVKTCRVRRRARAKLVETKRMVLDPRAHRMEASR